VAYNSNQGSFVSINKNRNPQVIYEDEQVLVVNKPAGMVVNRAETVRGETLQDWIQSNFSFPISKDSDLRSGIVHRLDKETSGVMVVAKTKRAFRKLQRQFKAREVAKTYLTLVHGLVEPAEGSVSLPLGRSVRNRERFTVSVRGKRAATYWRVLKSFKALKKSDVNTRGYQGFSLLEIKPETGRTHQIRVHLSHLNHPVVGDERYTGRKRMREDRKWCPRQFLHAFRLAFKHPQVKKKVEFEVKLAEDLEKALSCVQ
jgi:23S rRNA pseudouridine1911/1915/1917 synthase